MDQARADRVQQAVKMMLQECDGQPYDVRLRFGMLISTLRGHKLTPESFKNQPNGTVGRCEVCEQVVKVMIDGTSVEGRAAENDCPAAEWLRY